LGEILSQEISDHKMGIVTITDVEVSVDLRNARVYYSFIGGKKDIQKQKNIIEQMSKHLRHSLAERVVLKYIPKLQMIYDETPEKAQKLEEVFAKIRREKNED
jgi:ribosome-binding factor A